MHHYQAIPPPAFSESYEAFRQELLRRFTAALGIPAVLFQPKERPMHFRDVEREATSSVDEAMRERAAQLVAERYRELLLARKAVKRLEEEYEKLLATDVEEMLTRCPQGESVSDFARGVIDKRVR